MLITPTEKVMAKAENLDPEYVHKFMCTWERHCDATLSLPAEEYQALWDE
jgi:hypothetical protein